MATAEVAVHPLVPEPYKRGRGTRWSDEEPEVTTIEYWMLGGCTFCGAEDHERTVCPSRPLGDWT